MSKIKVFYTVCTDGSSAAPCSMPTLDANGSSGLVEQLDLTETVVTSGDLTLQDVTTSLRYTGRVEHDPEICRYKDTCRYIFSVFNPSPNQTPRKATFEVTEIITEEI